LVREKNMSLLRIPRICMVILLLLSLAISPVLADWHISVAVDKSSHGQYPALAYDKQGLPHIAYYDSITGDIMHTWQDSPSDRHSWKTEIVDSIAGTNSVSMAFDPAGNLWICYGDGLHFGNLMIAQKNGKKWNTTIVDTGGYPVRGALIGAAYGGAVGAIGGGIVCSPGGPGGSVGCAIVGGASGAGIGAYAGSHVGRAIGDVGQYSWLAFDRRGVPHIAYNGKRFSHIPGGTDVPNVDVLYYASLNPETGNWENVEVDDQFFSKGSPLTLGIDAQDNPHIAYLHGTYYPNLMYATSSDQGITWKTTKVDNGGSITGAVWMPCLALDSKGSPHISYYDERSREVRYASKKGNTWSTEAIDLKIDRNAYPSLAIDSHDNPYVSYFDAQNRAMKTWSTVPERGRWTRVRIFDLNDIEGLHSSIAIDPADHPGVVYHDEKDQQLEFAQYFVPES
jgi:hypothetical protein